MFFVIDKPRFERIIAIVREDRTARTQWARGPYMRLARDDGQLTLKGSRLEAKLAGLDPKEAPSDD